MIKSIKKSVQDFIISLKPTYAVEVDLYHVIPGVPVKSNKERHDFDKGEFQQAKTFFDEAIVKTSDLKLAPAEIKLIKGRKKVLEFKHFGPVNDIRPSKGKRR
ncbi:hypothetical protein [Marivirga harenae]|uniref:hypothetical protein n=1 Tax=Marivirga harenae TaxID=2010992 RepID=UPI0026E01E08|nr:hypothetical protein [Marivirga harenae]WKV12331.1 hypothetical protein Q3Y49_00570 [Marivirga harenae]|tara:strand:+ start:27103 stop:27411 length:309 start_codon:yes stop_codon:yes gene_type:complete